MAPWEIWTFDFPVEGTHPCVVFSNAARLASPDVERVNVLLCRTLRGPLGRPLKANEILLNGADGLDWETLCRVDALHFVRKADLRQRRGLVTVERQRMISQRLLQLFPFRF
jgi:hypothetical protein